MRAVPFVLLGLLAAAPVAAEHRFADALAGILLAEVQTQLSRRGYLADAPSGRDDAATTAAIRAWQADAGLPVTGIADSALLNHLRFGGGPSRPLAPAGAVRPVTPPASAAQAREASPLSPSPLPDVQVEPLPAPRRGPETANAPAEAFDI